MLLLTLCWGTEPVSAQPRPDVTSWVEPDTIRRGEPFILNVTANTPAHREVWFPDADADSSVFGDLTVLRRSKVYTRPVGVMYAIDSVSYTMTTSARDSVRVPPIPVRVGAAMDTVQTETLPFVVPITDQRGQMVLGEVEAGSSFPGRMGWSLLGLVVVAGLGGGVYLWRRTGTEEASTQSGLVSSDGSDSARSPYEQARERLENLRSRDLTEGEAVEAVYVALSGTISDYLALRLAVAARERTTSELLVLLRRHEKVPDSAIGPLRDVLEEADLVKFAGHRPDAGTARKHVQEALAALDAIENGPPVESTAHG